MFPPTWNRPPWRNIAVKIVTKGCGNASATEQFPLSGGLDIGRRDRVECLRVALGEIPARADHLEECEVPGLSRVRPPIEREVPEEVGFRPRELLAADRRLSDALELGEETRLGRGGVLGRRAEVRDEEAGSGPERYQDPERIGEPALLPELDEESARHPAAEHGAQHADGGIRRIAEPGPEVAHEDLRLLGRPLENAPCADRRGGRGGTDLAGARARELREEPLGGPHDARVRHLAAHREHDSLRLEHRAIVRDELAAREPPDGGREAEAGPRGRIASVELPQQGVEAQREGW